MREELLRSKITANKMNVDDFLDKLPTYGVTISHSAFYRKKNGESDFTRKEIIAISQVLNLSRKEMITIFFNQKVS